MEICVFYSWQSKYKKNCDSIIDKALSKAVKSINSEQQDYHYVIKRGGEDVVGEEDITDSIDRIIRTEADIAIVDFTHTGIIPRQNPDTKEWTKEKCQPNANVLNEHGKLVMALNEKQVFKVYNTAYGTIDVNLDPPFDLRQKHYPIPFFCDDSKSEIERAAIKEELAKEIKKRIKECTDAFVDNQKVRYAPLVPIRNEYSKKYYNTPFDTTDAIDIVFKKVISGQSFRLLGLPGLGKTRMVGEAFRGRDNDVYYCDCKEQPNKDVIGAVERLMSHRSNRKQTVVLDNCSQGLCGQVSDFINEFGFNCQLITIHYDPGEKVDSGIEGISLKVDDFAGVVEKMVAHVTDMPKDTQAAIINLSGGFPLMASIMIDNYHAGLPIASISKGDVFNRMLGVNPGNSGDADKLKVLTAFSIFKFIGLYGLQEKQGRFISNNRIITNLHGSEDENLQLFREVHGQYEKIEILERQGNLVLMRLIPLAIYLLKKWFEKQTTDSISDLISQIRSCSDEGTRNMLIESISRRIILLSEVPLAKELNDGLTDPDNSPFLTEEVVLSAPGSRLFLAFSEVNPESCAFALYRMTIDKSDGEIKAFEPARRNLAWALDHLAFDKRSFKYAMLTLARFSLIETEGYLSNNTTALFTDRFRILLPGTEVDLMARVDVLKILASDIRYEGLIKKALLSALYSGDFQRMSGAENQGMKKLKDYIPSYQEVASYYNICFDLFLNLAKTEQDIEDVAKSFASNARWYYLRGADDFLFKGLEIIAPKKNYVWEEMKDSLTYLIEFDAKKRKDYRLDEIKEWKKRLTKDDYVYTLLHLGKDIGRRSSASFEDEIRLTHERYGEMAKTLVDKQLYKDSVLMSGVMKGDCFHYNSYGMVLSSHSKEVGLQKEVLGVLLDQVLYQEVSRNGETLFVYFMMNVEDNVLLEQTYEAILHSKKKRLLPAIFTIKSESKEKLALLFELLDKGELTIADFSGCFTYPSVTGIDRKYVIGRLLDYGAEGAGLVLSFCHNLLFGEKEPDLDYQTFGRKCLLSVDLQGIQKNEYEYFQSMNAYLNGHRDDEMAMHIQDLLEIALRDRYSRDTYYLGRLYRKVLRDYTDLLKPRLFVLLEDEYGRHSWMDFLRTSYPQEMGEEDPLYKFIQTEEWFNWLDGDTNNDRAYALAMVFNYEQQDEANPEMLKLIDGFWCNEVKSALSSRFHSFFWSGTGIPLFQSRIALYEDYISKLANSEAKDWFRRDISYWKNQIQDEVLQNAHERAIYE